MTDEAVELVSRMLQKDPRRRPSAVEVLSHPWLQTPSLPHDLELKGGISVLAKLRDFQAGSKLRQAALHLITSQFTPVSEQRHIRDVFMTLDTNKDGRLSREELMTGFDRLGLGTEEDVVRIMENCDTDGSGYIELTEFVTATLNWKRVLDKDLLQAAFKAFDRDGDGRISADELRYMFEGNEEVEQLVWDRMVSECGSRDLDFEEFSEIMVHRGAKECD